jgi:hypothetical protein
MCFVFAVEPVEFVKPLSDLKVGALGECTTFECEVSKADARAQWLKDGHEIYGNKKYDIYNRKHLYGLTVRDIEAKDSGDYAVVVRGHRSSARLSVEAKPEFIISDLYSKPITLHVGEATVIEVPFRGSPQPRATWKFEGIHISENRKKYSETIYNMTSLTLSRVTLDDAGTYSLLLENNFGSTQMSVRVIVLGKRLLTCH